MTAIVQPVHLFNSKASLIFLSLLCLLALPRLSSAQVCTDGDIIEQLQSGDFLNFTPTQGVGQSFTAPCTGRLRSIDIDMFTVDEGPIVGSVRIFQGDAASGAEIGAASYYIEDTGLQRTYMQSYVPIEAGQVYTFFFEPPTSGTGNIYGLNGNPYTGGAVYAGPDASNLTVFGADATFAMDFGPAECTPEDQIEQLLVNAFGNLTPTQGIGQTFTAPCTGRIDAIEVGVFGVEEAPIVGALEIYAGNNGAAGALLASVPYSFSDTGMQRTDIPLFVPIEAGQSYTFFVAAPTSGSGNISAFNGNPYAGGLSVVGPDASNLSLFGSDETFSIDLAPAACTASDSIEQPDINAFFTFSPTQGVAQSFTAPCHGELRSVAPYLFSVDNSPIDGTLRIFAGNAASGPELARASYSFDATGLKSIALPHPIALEGGNVYTFFFDAPSSGIGNIAGFNGNPYVGGGAFAGPDANNLGGFATDVTFSIELGPRENVSEQIANLTRFYFSTDGDAWDTNDNWLIGSVDTWHGLSTDNGEVRAITLPANGLAGQLPPEVGNLTSLESVELSGNDLSGPLPSELGNLTNVSFFSVYENQLSDTVPPEIGNMSSLDLLQLGRNQFSGDLPTELSNLSNLTALFVEDNDFTGSIPSSFGGLSNLRELDLSGNRQMNGTLPIELTMLSNLIFLDISNTGLCDNLDPAFQSWTSTVTTVIAAGCTNVSNESFGSIPTEFALQDNYPNPFNPTTTIAFDVAETMNVQLQIFDITGRLIETLVSETLSPGQYERTWQAQNVASGIYMYRITAGDFTQTRQMLLLK